MPPTASRATLRFVLLGLPFLAVLTHSAPDPAAGGADRRGLLGELARIGTPRMVGPFLSIAPKHRPCTVRLPPDGTVPRTECPAADAFPTANVLALTARASEAVRAEVDPEALHAAALLDLLWGDDAGNSAQRSISYLQTAVRLTDRPAPVLADLAAAHLLRAERTQNARDLLEAVEAAEQAVELEPRHRAALFNRALALDRLGLDGEATEAWREFLMVDFRSGWAMEAKERVRVPAAAPRTPSPPPAGATVTEIAAYAARAPQEARLHGWDHLLGEWGAAVLAGDSARAEERLRLAGALGDALEKRGGDATLADAVRAIRERSGERAPLRALARAHRAYAGGRSAYLAADYTAAGERLAEALAVRAPSPALEGWARMFHTATEVAAGRLDAAERAFRRLGAQTDTARHPALAGAVRWGLATTLLRSGRYEQARDAALEAAGHFERADEQEHLGGAHYLVADTEFALRAALPAYASMHRALGTLRRYRGSVWLYNLLGVTADAAAADGLSRAALRIQDEGVAVAEHIGRPVYVAEARLSRAQLLAAMGDLARAEEDVRAGQVLVQRMEPGPVRSWLAADLRLTRADAALRTDPARAAAALDSTLASPGAVGTTLRLLRALVGRSEARLALGDAPGAAADLERATALLDEQRAAVTSAPLRASLVDAARGVFDRLVMLKVASGEPVEALAYLERARTSLAPTGPGESGRTRGRWRVPHGTVAVEYALIGDTLLVWTATDTTVHLTRRTVPGGALARTVERASSGLELRADEAALRRDLAALYEWLIRPVEGRIGSEGTSLVVVADGEVAGVPFAALYDPVRRRHLVETHPIRFAGSLRDAVHVSTVESTAPVRALFVADPALDPRSHPGLERLTGAAAEVEAMAAEYPGRMVLAGPAARRPAFGAALERADVFHFAGHAVFDDERPERSFLVLAPGSGGEGSDRLTAAEVEEMKLGHLRLVVLSACRTLRSRAGRSGGFAGLTDALLSAGAGGVVGSLWRVDDQLTRALMVEFHRAYRRSGDGPGALREAQLRLLRSPDPALRSPAAWAGFRYAGN